MAPGRILLYRTINLPAIESVKVANYIVSVMRVRVAGVVANFHRIPVDGNGTGLVRFARSGHSRDQSSAGTADRTVVRWRNQIRRPSPALDSADPTASMCELS